MKYYIVDAFTDRPFGGNPAGVVLLDGGSFPAERLMMQIAAELRYSETAFVLPLSPAEYELRYFTPKAEVELCGHATIATFSLLRQLGLAEGLCQCRTSAGTLRVEVREQVMMQMAAPRIVATIADPAALYNSVGLEGYTPVLPVQVAYAGLADIMLPVPDVEALQAMRPDMDAVAALTARHNAVSFHAFALADDGYTAHVRDFAPLYGVPEESATGTANAALTHYLAVNGVVPTQGDFAFLQGEAMGRPSVVATRVDAAGSVFVGGRAYILACGDMNLWPPSGQGMI